MARRAVIERLCGLELRRDAKQQIFAAVRGDEGKPCVFTTRAEAEREIADNMMTRLQEFMDGERDFDDAMTVEEYVMEVDQMPDGSIVTEDGSTFR